FQPMRTAMSWPRAVPLPSNTCRNYLPSWGYKVRCRMVHPNYIRIIKLAFPIILANASVPLLGLADTAVIGQTGTAADLGAIALASLIFNFVYWGFGFLRMGTTGFIAQSIGAGDMDEAHALLFRSVLLGGGIGLLLVLLQSVVGTVAIGLLTASEEIKSLVGTY